MSLKNCCVREVMCMVTWVGTQGTAPGQPGRCLAKRVGPGGPCRSTGPLTSPTHGPPPPPSSQGGPGGPGGPSSGPIEVCKFPRMSLLLLLGRAYCMQDLCCTSQLARGPSQSNNLGSHLYHLEDQFRYFIVQSLSKKF